LDSTIHPLARELCNNGRDDDCNGLVDTFDPACAPTCGPMVQCRSLHDCQIGTTTCGGMCCTPCPVFSPPLCVGSTTPSPPTPDMLTGCPSDIRCVPTGICPFIYAPVCAELGRGDARTFANSCEAGNAMARIIHTGECLASEGLLCSPRGPGCGPGTYCRDSCPECDSDLGMRCTKIGACTNDLDCPAGASPPPPMSCPDGSQASTRCVANACVRRCGP
jgi:hypothetical protein